MGKKVGSMDFLRLSGGLLVKSILRLQFFVFLKSVGLKKEGKISYKHHIFNL
jgi:hypothetical protein